MFASQLLQILQTFPTNANNETCDFDTDEVKEAMKESPKRYTNPFLSDEENEKVNSWNNQELYTDKNVMEMECELPELLVCYKESAFHVKDICVDEGIPHGEKILFDEDNKHDDVINGSLHMEDYYMESNHHMDIGDNLDEGVERNLDIQVQDLQNSIPEKDCEDDDDEKDCETKKDAVEFLDPNVYEDDNCDDDGVSECAPEKLKVSEESDTVSKDIDNYAPEEQIDSSANLLVDKDKDRPLPSLKSLLDAINGVHDNDQQPCQSSVEETLKSQPEGNEAEKVGTSIQSTIISNENIEENNNGKPVIINGVQNPETVLERGQGDSSFSVAGPVSGLITYSGQIAFSGSVSIRSDSSTTSTRSFAFPILQTEWNSSPVRMAKADRRRLQKQRGWRNGLLCCRF